jgi:rRNA maturation RNase YbeY
MSKSKPPVLFHFLVSCSLPNRGNLKAFIRSVFEKEGRQLESVTIIFCDDNHLLNLNRLFLQHDFYTDILSFPLSSPHKPLIAEVYISIDRVRENAKNLNYSFKEELHRVIIHGILHFCGYKDKSSADIKKMRSLEDKWLKVYFKPNGFSGLKTKDKGSRQNISSP